MNEALALEQRLTNLSSVAEVDLGGIDNLGRYLTEDQTRKLELVREIKQEAAQIHFAPVDTKPVNIKELSRSLWILYGYLGWAIPSVPTNEVALLRELHSLQNTVSDLRDQILIDTPTQSSHQLGAFQRALFNDIRETFQTLRNQDASSRLTVNDIPPTLRKRFLGVTGKYLVQVYPKKDVWQRQAQKEFVQQVRTVDANVTGTPVQLYEYTTLLKDSYQEAAEYSLIAITILILLRFHRPLSVVLALLPVAIGSLWMTGIMGFFDIPFNPANIMTLPLVIGVGVTNGIHILNRFAEERHPSILAKSTGKAVLVSGLTTIAGFGSLIIAKHRGISSLGIVMSVGTATCMLAGLTCLPAVLHLIGHWSWIMKKKTQR